MSQLYFFMLVFLFPITFFLLLFRVSNINLCFATVGAAIFYSLQNNALLSMIFGVVVYTLTFVIVKISVYYRKNGKGIVLSLSEGCDVLLFTPKRNIVYKTENTENINIGDLIGIYNLSKIM